MSVRPSYPGNEVNGAHAEAPPANRPEPQQVEQAQQALALLAQLIPMFTEPLRVELNLPFARVTLDVRPHAKPRGDSPTGVADPIKLFSTTEESILEEATEDWQTKQQLADKCRLPASGHFSSLLTNLVERGYLDSGKRGYRLPNEEAGAQPCGRPPKTLGEQVLEVMIKEQRASLGDILGQFEVALAPRVRAAVAQLLRSGQLARENGVYFLPAAEGGAPS